MHTKRAASIAAGINMIATLATVRFSTGKDCVGGSTIKVDSGLDITISFWFGARLLARKERASSYLLRLSGPS